MASKKKSPSFEIPDAVRQAGQSGWVYRTGSVAEKRAKTTRPSAPLPRPPRADRVTPVAPVEVAPPAPQAPQPPTEPLQAELVLPLPPEPVQVAGVRSEDTTESEVFRSDRTRSEEEAPAAASGSSAVAARSVARWLFDIGVQLAVVPLLVPLYLLSGFFYRPAAE